MYLSFLSLSLPTLWGQLREAQINFEAVLGIRIRRIRTFLGLPNPDPLVRGTDPNKLVRGTDPYQHPAPDPSLFS